MFLDNKTLKTIGLAKATTGHELWAMGSFLKAPRYQDYVFELNRESYRTEPNHWLYADSVEAAYTLTRQDALLRSWIADLMNCVNPLKNLQRGSEEFLKWEALFERCPDIKIDMDNAIRKEWNDSHPWDDEYRIDYKEKEIPLDEAYEIQILEKRTLAEIKEATKTKEVISHIELAHLRRKRWQ